MALPRFRHLAILVVSRGFASASLGPPNCNPACRVVTYTEAIDVHPEIVDFEPAIWARLIQAPRAPIAPEAAHYLLSIDFSEADHARMRELMDKSNEGALRLEEHAELDGYVKIANVLSVCTPRLA